LNKQHDNLITIKEAAPIIGAHPQTVYDMVRDGTIPPGPLVRLGRRIRFNRDQLTQFIENGGTAGSKKAKAQNQVASLPATA